MSVKTQDSEAVKFDEIPDEAELVLDVRAGRPPEGNLADTRDIVRLFELQTDTDTELYEVFESQHGTVVSQRDNYHAVDVVVCIEDVVAGMCDIIGRDDIVEVKTNNDEMFLDEELEEMLDVFYDE